MNKKLTKLKDLINSRRSHMQGVSKATETSTLETVPESPAVEEPTPEAPALEEPAPEVPVVVETPVAKEEAVVEEEATITESMETAPEMPKPKKKRNHKK